MRRMFSGWDRYREWVAGFDRRVSRWWLRWTVATLAVAIVAIWTKFAIWCVASGHRDGRFGPLHPGQANSVRSWDRAGGGPATGR